MKRHGADLNVYCLVKEASLPRLHTIYYRLTVSSQIHMLKPNPLYQCLLEMGPLGGDYVTGMASPQMGFVPL